MSGDVENVVLEILKRIQEDVSANRRELAEARNDLVAFREDVAAFRQDVSTRLTRLETIACKHRRDIAGLLVVGNALAGDMDLRTSAVERRLERLEAAAPEERGVGRPADPRCFLLPVKLDTEPSPLSCALPD